MVACALGAFGFTLGCVVVEPTVDCGQDAYASAGECICEFGYDGDPYDACDPIQDWRVTDWCDDGMDVLWKLYSQDRDWEWPSAGEAYVTPGLQLDGFEAILCLEDEFICFGAEAGGTTWGVGLDGALSCDDCCFYCEAGTEVDIGLLTC